MRRLSIAPKEASGRDSPVHLSNGPLPVDPVTTLPPLAPGTPADMWSYGCVLAEALTGRKLFRARDQLAAVLR